MKQVNLLRRILPLFLLVTVMMAVPASLHAQTKTATGTVLDETGEPLIGVSVIQGKNGVTTDVDGKFSLPNIAVGSKLSFAFLGMETVEATFTGEPMKIVMREDATVLDEVIVIAYGEQKRSAFTGSASVLSSEDIVKRPLTNVTGALEGQTAGIQVAMSSGDPTATPTIRIRGISSVSAGSDPLIILDGVPYEGGINNINPSDVESMSVLKDASSTALYGARGGNGVIMITTKKAKLGEAVVTFDSRFGITTRRADRHDMITDPRQYIELHYLSLYNNYLNVGGLSPLEAHKSALTYMEDPISPRTLGMIPYTAPNGEYLIGTNGKFNPNATEGRRVTNSTTGESYWIQPDDWVDAAEETGYRHEYNVSINGGSEKMQLFTSLGYMKETGIVKSSMLERFTGRIKGTYQAKKWLTINANVGITSSQYDSFDDNVFYSLDMMAPIYPLYIRDENGKIMYDENGKMYDYGDGVITGYSRPIHVGHNYIQKNEIQPSHYDLISFTSQFGADFSITKDLKFTTTIGYDDRERKYTSLSQPFYNPSYEGGMVYRYHYRNWNLTLQQMLNYRKSFGSHNIQALLGHEYYKYEYNYLMGSKQNLFNYWDNQELSGAVLVNSTNSYTRPHQTEGYFTRALYDYEGKYFVDGSFRRDASTRFHKDYRWGSFYSFGGAWIMSKEEWFKSSFVDMLKFKLSFGQNGNDDIGYNRYEDLYDLGVVSGELSMTFRDKGKEKITWETRTAINTGFEFELFNRLKGELVYYYNKTTDMLTLIYPPASAGYASYYDNVGDMVNQGVELDLHADIIRKKDFRWNVYANASYNRNRVTMMPEERKDNLAYDFGKGTKHSVGMVDGSFIVSEGNSRYTWRVRKYAGPDEEGRATWYTTDPETGDMTTTTEYTKGSYYNCGDALPVVQGGFGTGVTWKNFDASIAFSYSIGGKAYDGRRAALNRVPKESYNGWAFHTDVLNAWTPENTETMYPRWQWNDNDFNQISDFWLYDRSWLKLQNITAGYTLPNKVVQKIGINSLRLAFTADNLFFWSHHKGLISDRSISGSLSSGNYYYPNVRKYILNLSFKF